MREEVVADFGCVSQQVFFFNRINDSDGYGAGQRTSAKGGAVHAGVDGSRRLFRADDRAQWDAARQWLGQRGYVGQNTVVLIGAPLAGTTHSGLNLIGNQQGSRRAGQNARLGEELLRNRANSAFALDGLYEDGANFIGEFGA